ncbi:MAG: hypothetical protein V3V59_02770 [Thermodesulfovibrionales bacterium]
MAKSSKEFNEPFWLIESKDLYKDLYIELDAILKGIDRFFNTENLLFDTDNLPEINFYNELIILRDSILRVLSILEVVLPESKKNAFWFKKFAETKLYSEQKRDYLIKEIDDPLNPERFVFSLYDSFINFKNLIVDILKGKKINYLSFKNIGDIIRKEIRNNDYFNPFRLRIHPEFDIITNHEIGNIVKSIGDRKMKRSISTSFIVMFRTLRYLDCIDTTTKRKISISCGLLLLSMIRSDIRQTIKFFKRELKKDHLKEFHETLQQLSFSLSIEQKRVYNQELRNILQLKNIRNLRGRIENSHGILKNLIEQSIVQVAECFDSSIKGESIFSTFITKMGQSMKLREDIYILFKLLTLFEENLSIDTKRNSALDSLKNYMLYFESFTFKLLRYDDYEEFSKFFTEFLSNTKVTPFSSSNSMKLTDSVHNFKIYLETTLNHINNRTELQDHPIDVDRARQLLTQYIQ